VDLQVSRTVGSTSLVVDLSQSAKMMEQLAPRIREAAIRGVRRAAARGLQVVVTRIVPSRHPPPVDRGVYRAGWKLESLHNGAAIYNDTPHANFIEYGVRASSVRIGRSMIDALTEWVRRKGIGGGATKAGKTRRPSESQAREIAWAIARRAQSKSGLAFFAGPRGDGFRVLRELSEQHLPAIIREEVAAEIAKVTR
jgi:hypothetical protein